MNGVSDHPLVSDLAEVGGLTLSADEGAALGGLFAERDGKVTLPVATLTGGLAAVDRVCVAAVLGWLFLGGERTVLWANSSPDLRDEAFHSVWAAVEFAPHSLMRHVAGRRAGNGEQGIVLRSGARVLFRSPAAGHGISVDRLILPAQDFAAWGVLAPAMAGRPDPQTVFRMAMIDGPVRVYGGRAASRDG